MISVTYSHNSGNPVPGYLITVALIPLSFAPLILRSASLYNKINHCDFS
jgi:hypothetical protein